MIEEIKIFLKMVIGMTTPMNCLLVDCEIDEVLDVLEDE